MHTPSGASLLINGREAFPEILRCIDRAVRSVEVHMFLWRADSIGMTVAEALLAAADRGVKVTITVDRYARSLETCEECGASFFHLQPTPKEQLQSFVLRCAYGAPIRPFGQQDRHRTLLHRILTHGNIRVHRDKVLADHSKYYVIDEEILFLGGINIEDKENGQDLSGRVYYDYMVKLEGRSAVEAFRSKTVRGTDLPGPFRFAVNSRSLSPHRFEMADEYLGIIRDARQELVIVMAYFSARKPIVDALLDAVRRGVRVTVMIPSHANFQNQSNRRTVKLLLRKSHGAITVLLSPRMIHTKLVCNEQRISLGSCNITNRAFRQLCELNLTVDRTDTPFCRRLLDHVREECQLALPVHRPSQIRSHPLIGWIEGFLC